MPESIQFSINPVYVFWFVIGCCFVFLLILVMARLRYILDPPRNPMTGQIMGQPQESGKLMGIIFIFLIVLVGSALLFSRLSPFSGLEDNLDLSPSSINEFSPPIMSSMLPLMEVASSTVERMPRSAPKIQHEIEFVDPPALVSTPSLATSPIERPQSSLAEAEAIRYTLQVESGSSYEKSLVAAINYAYELHPLKVYLYQDGSLTKIFIGEYADKSALDQQKKTLKTRFGKDSFRKDWDKLEISQMEVIVID